MAWPYSIAVEITCTVEAVHGSFSHVSETAATYGETLAAARAKVPDSCRMIAIRTDD